MLETILFDLLSNLVNYLRVNLSLLALDAEAPPMGEVLLDGILLARGMVTATVGG